MEDSLPYYGCCTHCVVSSPAMGRVLAGGELVWARERQFIVLPAT